MTSQRVRIRFQKQGDLRLISHRDLVRVFERMFRRSQLELKMSEGFHPKARMSFPSALALGIAGLGEVMEVELKAALPADEITRRLDQHAPAGLRIDQVRIVGPREGKPQVERFTYRIPVPPERRDPTQTAIENLLSQPSLLIHREGRADPLDLRAQLDEIKLVNDHLQFTLSARRTAGVRPREVLQSIGLADLENDGFYLSRTVVELAP